MKRLVSFASLILSATLSYAQGQGSVIRIDDNISVIKVRDNMESCFHRQYKDNWCWAACVQMVLEYYGLKVSQSRIVERAYGDDFNFTANQNDIISALNGWAVNGAKVSASFERYKSAKTLIDAITKGLPLIIGLDEQGASTGHAYVLTHIFFTTANFENMTPTRVVVVDPANNEDLEESLDWTDFYKRINTIITITKS